MPRVNWIIACTKASVDANTQNISLIELIEGVKATLSVPPGQTALVPIQFDVVVLSSRLPTEQPQTRDIRLQFLDPAGAVLGTTPTITADLLNAPRNRAITHIAGFPVNTAGVYKITAEFRDPASNAWSAAGSTEIEVAF
jgi:hypothetical protein